MRSKENYSHTKPNLVLNIIFYVMLLLLVGALIYPHTSFYYRKPFYNAHLNALNATDIQLEKGEFFRIYVVGINKKVVFKTTNYKVAEVDLSGNVQAKNVGTAIIKAKVKGRTLKCRVRVIKPKN